jgi:predicted PurR-regulated permease PerM
VADGPKFRRAICSRLPRDRQTKVLEAWDLAIAKTGGYLYSRAILAVLSAFFHWAAFSVIGVPYALALAVWVGLVSQFLPVVGTYLAGILPILVTIVDDPIAALWVLGFVVVYQQVENYLFAPRITSRTVDIHPAVAFAAVIAGAALFGAIGALLAIPIAATVQSFLSSYLGSYEVIDTHLTRENPFRFRRRKKDRPPPSAPTPEGP